MPVWRHLTAVVAVCVFAAVAALVSARSDPALAQGFFDRLFGPFPGGNMFIHPEPPRAPADSTRAPPPRKSETPPTSTIVVLGDSLADWLAYGLEDALSDSPEIGIVRKVRIGSGLIRYDLKNESLEWAQGAKEILANEKPTYIVMMIGLNDRQAIRVRQQSRTTPQGAKPPSDQEQDTADQPANTPEAQRQNTPGVYEFHTDRWEEIYSKRIDDTIAVLKAKNVPVFWVGLPAIRTTKGTTEMSYLNELFRARAEKAGIVYVDVWDGFVDELGRFMQQGPDYEGQNRRLRANDGVHFTRAGARKLAHYVEREIARVGPLQPEPVALPAEPQQQTPNTRPGGATARPLAGIAVPLSAFAYATVSPGLDGAPSTVKSDPPTQIAVHVLAKGESIDVPAGRADDFAWPRRGIAPFGTDPAVTATTMPVPLAQLPPPPPTTEAPSRTAAARSPTPLGPAAQAPPPRAPSRPSVFNPFSFLPFFR